MEYFLEGFSEDAKFYCIVKTLSKKISYASNVNATVMHLYDDKKSATLAWRPTDHCSMQFKAIPARGHHPFPNWRHLPLMDAAAAAAAARIVRCTFHDLHLVRGGGDFLTDQCVCLD